MPASENAHEILRLSARTAPTAPAKPDSPSPPSETTTSTAQPEWACKAFNTDRRSINSLSTVADELYHEAHAHYGGDPSVSALNDVIASFYASISDR